MALRKIREQGDEILTKKCREVKERDRLFSSIPESHIRTESRKETKAASRFRARQVWLCARIM